MEWFCDMPEILEIMEALENDIIEKKPFADMQPRRFYKGIYWMLVTFQTILWKFLEDINYAEKNDQRKFEGENGYCHIIIKSIIFVF